MSVFLAWFNDLPAQCLGRQKAMPANSFPPPPNPSCTSERISANISESLKLGNNWTGNIQTLLIRKETKRTQSWTGNYCFTKPPAPGSDDGRGTSILLWSMVSYPLVNSSSFAYLSRAPCPFSWVSGSWSSEAGHLHRSKGFWISSSFSECWTFAQTTAFSLHQMLHLEYSSWATHSLDMGTDQWPHDAYQDIFVYVHSLIGV